jgi:hypothetical protein
VFLCVYVFFIGTPVGSIEVEAMVAENADGSGNAADGSGTIDADGDDDHTPGTHTISIV